MKDCKLSICELDGAEKKVTLEFVIDETLEDYKNLGDWDEAGIAADYYRDLISSSTPMNVYGELLTYASEHTHSTLHELKDLVNGVIAAFFTCLK